MSGLPIVETKGNDVSTIRDAIAEFEMTFETTHHGLLVQQDIVKPIDEGDVEHEEITRVTMRAGRAAHWGGEDELGVSPDPPESAGALDFLRLQAITYVYADMPQGYPCSIPPVVAATADLGRSASIAAATSGPTAPARECSPRVRRSWWGLFGGGDEPDRRCRHHAELHQLTGQQHIQRPVTADP
jgi:hypothetical protein